MYCIFVFEQTGNWSRLQLGRRRIRNTVVWMNQAVQMYRRRNFDKVYYSVHCTRSVQKNIQKCFEFPANTAYLPMWGVDIHRQRLDRHSSGDFLENYFHIIPMKNCGNYVN